MTKTRIVFSSLRQVLRRNRERILEVAKEAFTRFGAEASLDDIAKQAEVEPELFIGTCHFSNLEAIVF